MADIPSGLALHSFEEACERFSLSFPAIAKARAEADEKLQRINNALEGAQLRLDETTLSLVVFGSIARREWTTGSDVDWTLLVDGPVDPEHFRLAISIGEVLEKEGFPKPGDTGTFGTLASSHDLVHRLGGPHDTNGNMTRRLLLLLESRAVINAEVRDRVITSILNRYIVCGRGIREHSTTSFRLPRFLLNDVVRYWRTIAVDYAAKKWEQANKKWALRNAKLRVPRKIIFAKGLLLNFDCELFADAPPWSDLTEGVIGDNPFIEERLALGIAKLAELTPIDLLCRALLLLEEKERASEILGVYSEFLELIDDPDNRSHLETLTFDTAVDDAIFKKVRHDIGGKFGNLLEDLFFRGPEKLVSLTQKYGVF